MDPRERLRKMLPLVLVAAVLLNLVAVGCGGNKLKEGTVYDHRYDSPDSWTTTYCSMYSYDSKGNQTGCLMWSTDIHHDPEHFTLMVQGPDPDNSDKILKEGHEVPESLWREAEIGDHVDLERMVVT